MLHRVLPTATTDVSLRILSLDPGFKSAMLELTGRTLSAGDSLLSVMEHEATTDTASLQELQKLLAWGQSLSVPVASTPANAPQESAESGATLVVSAAGVSQRQVILVADEARSGARREECNDSEAQLATLAGRLQAVLASAVDLDSSIHDTQSIYHAAFENLSAAIPFDTGSIQMLDGSELEIVACTGFSLESSVTGLQFPLDDRFPNYYVITGKTPLALDDIRVDFPHFLTSEGEFGSGHIRTWMGVPLLDRGQVIGMITMDRDTVSPFDPDEIELAQALANHTAVALSNARMYESLQHANELQYMLLRELHHRVKNNLQLVSSLLNLRSIDVDEGATRLIDELRTHIQALAATHDNIFQPGLSEDVMLKPYVDDIARGIEAAYAPSHGSIPIVRNVPDTAHCTMEIAVPLGLITSELILNAMKHAFPGDKTGVITVTVVL
ncbi:MAG: histidine kinase dimerization/phosphoacceptor domain -containing protein, partial [Alkalispirochaeta sp.]